MDPSEKKFQRVYRWLLVYIEENKFSGNQTLSLVVGSCNTSVSGTVGKNAVDMVIDVDVEGGIEVKVNYKGTKLSGSENSEAK